MHNVDIAGVCCSKEPDFSGTGVEYRVSACAGVKDMLAGCIIVTVNSSGCDAASDLRATTRFIASRCAMFVVLLMMLSG